MPDLRLTDGRALACFDLDGTLLAGDSFRLFMGYALRKGLVRPSALALCSWTYLMRRCRVIGLKEAKARLLAPLRGRSRHVLAALAQAFCTEVLLARLRPDVVAVAKGHIDSGDYTVALTSAPDLYLPGLAEHLGLQAAYGSPLCYAGNRFTGELGQHLFGRAKVVLVDSLVHSLCLAGSPIYAYADHHSDLPLLLFSSFPHAVYPTRRLRAEAERRGWPIIVES